MTTAAQDDATIPAGSPSPTPQPPSSKPPRVSPPTLGVRPTPSASTANTSDPSADYANAANDQGPADPLGTGTPSSGRSADPGPDAVPLKFGNELRDTMRGLVMAGSTGVHHTLARTDVEIAEGLWLLTDETEAASIADPLASIAKRYAGGTLMHPDAGDLIRAGLATAVYLARNTVRTAQIRIAYRRARAAGMNPDPEQNPNESETTE